MPRFFLAWGRLLVLLPLLPVVAVIVISQSCYHAFIEGEQAPVSPLERRAIPWARAGVAPIQFSDIPFQDFANREARPEKARPARGAAPEPTPDRATAVRGLRLAGYAGRTLWSTTTSLYLLTQLASFAAGGCLLFSAAPGPRRSRLGWLIVVLAVTGAATAGLAGTVRSSYATTGRLLEKTVAVDWGREGAADVSHLSDLERAIAAIDLSGASAIIFLGLAIGVTLVEASPPTAKDREDQALFLAQQMERQRQILYVGTVLLIVALLQANGLYRWALAFVYPTEGLIHKSLESLVVSLVVGRGVLDSLLLAALYLPAALLLKARAAALVPPMATEPGDSVAPERPRRFPEVQDWLKEHGLASDPQELIPRVAAILGPLLAGSATQILDVLKPGA